MESGARIIQQLTVLCIILQLGRAVTLNCKEIIVEKVKWNLEALGGPITVSHIDNTDGQAPLRLSYTLDICEPLQKVGDHDCPGGTHVCAKEYFPGSGDGDDAPKHVFPIAGEYSTGTGAALDPLPTRLLTSDADVDKEGLRLVLHGGKNGDVKQKAVIDFLCPKSSNSRILDTNFDNEESVQDKAGGTLRYRATGTSGDAVALKLEWTTPYACENAIDHPPDKIDVPPKDDPKELPEEPRPKGGWSFAAIFFFVLFLAVILYLGFFAWVNYNQHGARGWDLLPHSDILREIPWVLTDWFRRVLGMINGGMRGGYSAV